MATQVLFTTVESVRAALGVDESDLPATYVTDPILKTQFTLDLESWYPDDYVSDWNSSGYDPLDDSDVDIIAPSASLKKGLMLSAYSLWFAALKAVDTLLAIPLQVSDGKNAVRRFDKKGLVAAKEAAIANLNFYKQAILEDLSSATVSVLGPSKSESEIYDPITGE